MHLFFEVIMLLLKKSENQFQKGFDTSAIMGFTNSLLDVIKRERPDHLAVCFDKGGSVDRLEIVLRLIRANRDETPEAIKIAIPYIEQILKAMHIPIYRERRVMRADDIIGNTGQKKQNSKAINLYGNTR